MQLGLNESEKNKKYLLKHAFISLFTFSSYHKDDYLLCYANTNYVPDWNKNESAPF